MSIEGTISVSSADSSGELAYENPERAGAAARRSEIGKIDLGTDGRNRMTGSPLDDLLSGAGGNDILRGGAGKDILDGGDGNDGISGGADTDLIVGGLGNDKLTGGLEADMFFFDTALHKTKNVDRITDFKPTEDIIALDNAIFKKAGKVLDTLDAQRFWTGSKAQDRLDRIIYNEKTGALSYDPDGSGKAAQIKFAQLKAKLALTADDFQIV